MRLFHKDAFSKRSLQKCCVDVEMVETERVGSGELQDSAKSGELKCGCKRVGVIDTFDLGITFGDPTSFVLFKRAIGHVLVFENPLTFADIVTGLVEDELPRLSLGERGHLFVSGNTPTRGIRARPGLTEVARLGVTSISRRR